MQSRKKPMILIVNADDAGIDSARNRGILRAAREGIVRSASVLATFPAAREFVEGARSIQGLGIGLHFNLTAGSPAVPGQRSLVGKDGRFTDKSELWRRAKCDLLEIAEVRRELEAQWEALRALGADPTHLDGHNHAHIFPGVADAVREALPEGTWVRLPCRHPAGAHRTERDDEIAVALENLQVHTLPADPFESPETLVRTICALARSALKTGWRRFRFADRFEGPSLPRGYGARNMLELLSSLAKGWAEIVEVMTHPGETCEDSVPYSTSPDRLRELEALVDPGVLDRVKALGIELRSFGDLR